MSKTDCRHIISLLVFMTACLSWGGRIAAQDNPQHPGDTTRRQNLDPVVISRQHKPTPSLSQAPVQVVDAERIEQTGAILLSEALKQMAGVTLKDYGGIGGMKTVSARGLGSQFSTLTIDGVAVNDCQNGQVDLGRYMVGNSAYISLSNGQQEEMLLSARATAAGSTINMETRTPSFMPGEKTHLQVGIEGGSFGMLSPTLMWEQRLGRKLSMTFWGNYLKSDGDYPFTLFYTVSHQDSSSVERREHSAMWLATGDWNLFYRISPNRTLSTKVHYVQSYHELPGPVVYYSSKGSEDTREQLLFAQVKYRSIAPKINFQLIGKYQYSSDAYEDFNAPTLSRYLLNEYGQHEGYLSATLQWKPLSGFSTSLSSDAAVSALHSNLARNSDVTRLTSLSVATLQYKNSRIDIKGNLLATVINENACDINHTIQYRKLSPYIGFSLKPFKNREIRLRYFFKETYRVPNFNEMYYFTIPRDLRPERALQHNIGLTLSHRNCDSVSTIVGQLTVDGYRNRITDKIIAVPTQNMFLWSMMNLGLVGITGLDLQGSIDWQRGETGLCATITYTFQKAIDITDPESKTYGHQITYTPRHSGGATLYLRTRWLNLGYSCMLVGERYFRQQNLDETRLPAYADHGITADRTFELPIGDLRLQLQLLNLLDVQYEVVRSYPMMGRNFRIKATYSF